MRVSQVTPEEFAAQAGLSLEEAEVVLRRREYLRGALAHYPLDATAMRIKSALDALHHAEQKVGVKPYEENK